MGFNQDPCIIPPEINGRKKVLATLSCTLKKIKLYSWLRPIIQIHTPPKNMAPFLHPSVVEICSVTV